MWVPAPPTVFAKASDAGVGPIDGTDGGGTNGAGIAGGKGTASAGNAAGTTQRMTATSPQPVPVVVAAGFGGGGGNAVAGGGGVVGGGGSSYLGADPTNSATVRTSTATEAPAVKISYDGVAPSTTDDVPTTWQLSPVTRDALGLRCRLRRQDDDVRDHLRGRHGRSDEDVRPGEQSGAR